VANAGVCRRDLQGRHGGGEQPDEEVMGYQESVGHEGESKQNRIHEGDVGKVRFRIYRNVNLKGEFLDFKFKLFRRESDGTKKWLAGSYFHEDMSDVSGAAMASYIWLRDNTDDCEIRLFPDAIPVVIPVKESTGKSRLIYGVQFGDVVASVFENTSPKGNLFHKFSFRRVELFGEGTVTWKNFRPEDSRHLGQAAIHCRIWYQRNIGSVQRPAVTESGEEKRPAKRKPRRAAK
jgi:hypothetical protein